MVNATIPGKDRRRRTTFYNYRDSRTRRVIKNCFETLLSRFRILQKTIRASAENVEKYVLVSLALHDYLRWQIIRMTHLLVLLIRKINMKTLYQENGYHKMKMQFSVVAIKVSVLFEVPDHVLMR